MSTLIYKKLNVEQASLVWDEAERLKLDFDIQNAEEVFFGDGEHLEFGLNEADWTKVLANTN